MDSTRFIGKYNTPRPLQILLTITLIVSIFILLFVNTFEIEIVSSRLVGSHYQTSSQTRTYTIFSMFSEKDGDRMAYFLVALSTIASIVGIVFIWLNRPKIALIGSSILFVVMLLSLIVALTLSLDDIYSSYDPLWTHMEGKPFTLTYYILCLFVIASLVLSIVSLKTTKDGPRQPKILTVKSESRTLGPDDLLKYKELYESGVITEEEYEKVKQRILNI